MIAAHFLWPVYQRVLNYTLENESFSRRSAAKTGYFLDKEGKEREFSGLKGKRILF